MTTSEKVTTGLCLAALTFVVAVLVAVMSGYPLAGVVSLFIAMGFLGAAAVVNGTAGAPESESEAHRR